MKITRPLILYVLIALSFLIGISAIIYQRTSEQRLMDYVATLKKFDRTSRVEQLPDVDPELQMEDAADPNSELSKLESKEEPKYKRFPRLTSVKLRIHEAAVREYFKIIGLSIEKIGTKFEYDIDSTDNHWVILEGSTPDRTETIVIAASNLNDRKALVALVEKKWEMKSSEWKAVQEAAQVQACARCEFFEIPYRDKSFIAVLAKSAKSKMYYFVASDISGATPNARAKILASQMVISVPQEF